MNLQVYSGVIANRKLVIVITSMKDGYDKDLINYDYYVNEKKFGSHQQCFEPDNDLLTVLHGLYDILGEFSRLANRYRKKNKELSDDFNFRHNVLVEILKETPSVEKFEKAMKKNLNEVL